VARRSTSATTVALRQALLHERPHARSIHAARVLRTVITVRRVRTEAFTTLGGGLMATESAPRAPALTVHTAHPPLNEARVNSIAAWGRPTRG
jgi:hypothetical protein